MIITEFLKNQNVARSTSIIRRTIIMGGVKVNSELELNIDRELKNGDIVEIGKDRLKVEE